jgi:hypothetical protein
MKTSFKTLVLALAMLFTVSTFAQQPDTIQVDVTKLSAQELQVYQSLKQKQMDAANQISVANITPEKLDKYAQIGKSFGTAFKECWSTVSTDAERFAQSDAGKMTMFLIAWKIVGQDGVNLVEKAVQYSIGIPLIVVGTIFFIYIFRRNCTSRPKLVNKTQLFGILTIKSEYAGEIQGAHSGDGAPLLYGVCYLILIGVSCAIMFAG